MSFTTTSQLNTLLLRGLQVRTNSNTPISTFFALYADGRGGTFWDQALRASDLSSYSTSVAAIAEDQSTLVAYTTSSITGMEGQIIVLEDNFSTLSGSVSTQIDQAIFSFSTNQYFIDQLSSIQSNLETEISSLYSTLSTYDADNFSTLSSYIIISQNVNFGYTDSSISTVYTQSISTSQVSLDAFSTSINNAVISTNVAFASTIFTQNSSLAIYISTDTAQTASTNSSFMTMFSTTDALLSSLEYMSTTLLSTISTYTDSHISTSQAYQNMSTQSTFTSIFNSLQLISTTATSTALIALSTANSFAEQISILTVSTAQNTSSIIGLNSNFNLLTTSTLITSIYQSFLGLEQFCSTLVVSTNDALEAIFISTTNVYIDSTYSTIVDGVIILVEEILSSAIQSTTNELYSTFVSTISTIYDEFVVDLNAQLDSSIGAYVSTPIVNALSTFSTMTYEVISTFSTAYEASLSTFSTMTYQEISTFSTAYEASLSTFSTMTYQEISTFSTAYEASLSTFSTMTYEEISTFSTAYEASLSTFSTLTVIEISTFSTLYNSTLSGAGITVNNFVAGLQNYVSTSALSTLYTQEHFTLSGTNSTASLNIPAYRNFVVNVSDVIDTSQYRITYDPTALYGMDWVTGTILINVQSTGSYSANNGKIVMDTYRWGFPTSIYDSMFPTLSSADYTLLYDYRIYNSTIYTSLQNIYPRLRILNASASGGGGSVTANWSNYSWFPTGLLGAPPFSPQINVDLLQGGALVQRVGPFDITVSTATFATSASGAVNLSIYFAGNFGEGAVVSISI
jgi:hypothetical protein